MPDLPRPQDAEPTEPVTDVDQEIDPTPQGRVGDPDGLVDDDEEE